MKILATCIVCILVMSCTKQKAFAPNAGDFIVVGDAENMLVKTYENTFFPGNSFASQLAIDVDDDQVNDFAFYYSGISKTNWSSELRGLTGTSNDYQVYGNFGIDTTFLLESLETGTSLPTAFSSITNYTIHTASYNCSRNSAQSKVSSINQHAFRVKVLDSLAHLVKSSDFENDTIILFNYSQSNFPTQISTTQMYTERTYYRLNCSFFAENKSYYIGVQIHKKNRYYLGWIKFMNLYGRIELLETAIQKQ